MIERGFRRVPIAPFGYKLKMTSDADCQLEIHLSQINQERGDQRLYAASLLMPSQLFDTV